MSVIYKGGMSILLSKIEGQMAVRIKFRFLLCFIQVEMFVISNSNQSDDLYKDILNTQREMFSKLGLHYRLVQCRLL